MWIWTVVIVIKHVVLGLNDTVLIVEELEADAVYGSNTMPVTRMMKYLYGKIWRGWQVF